jgi:hypothetical protein
VRTGTPLATPNRSQQDWHQQLGPDGTAYLLAYSNSAPTDSEITAFDMSGVHEGWPVQVMGHPSGLAFGPDGATYVTETGNGGKSSRILVFGPDGRSLSIGSEVLPVMATGAYQGAGPFDGAPPPVVVEDGTTYLVTEDRGTTVYGLDATGQVMAGWPYREAVGLQWEYCPPDTGGSCRRPDPAVGTGALYLLHPPRSATLGGSIVAIGRDGLVRPGWPVVLTRGGSHFRRVVTAPDGTVYALAVEPEVGDSSSASILAIGPDSTVIWTTTIVEP